MAAFTSDKEERRPAGPQPGGHPGGGPAMGMGMGGPGQNRGLMPKAKARNQSATLKRLWAYLGRQRAGLALVAAVTALAAGLALIGPYLIGVAIDHYIIPRDYGGLTKLCAGLAAIYAVSALFTWLQGYMMAGVAQRTVRELRRDLFAKLQDVPLSYIDSRTHGDLMSRTTNDIENVSNSLNQSVTQLMTSLITVVGSLALMLSLNVWLTLVALLTVPAVLLTTGQIAKRTRSRFAAQQQMLGELNGYIQETVSGQRTVKAYAREEAAQKQFDEVNRRLHRAAVPAQIFSGAIGPMMNVINNSSFALLAAVGGWMTLQGAATIGIVVSFLNYSRQFSRPINELANQFNMIQAAVAGAERVFEVLDQPTEYADERESAGRRTGLENTSEAADTRPEVFLQGEVVFRGVDFGYKPGTTVLRGFDLVARPGETIALVGPTGAGKTTVINLLTRFYEIDRGEIAIDGVDIRRMRKDELRRRLGIVLQDAYVFADTVRENIRYGRLDASDEEVEMAARQAMADGFIRKLPNGYDTVLAAEGGNLSQGERQLLTIARAVLADPAILILDEATSSVDTRTEMQIQQAMRALMAGRTSFVIAHRLSTIREADQILVVRGGEIAESGRHEELLARGGFYHALYTSQLEETG